MPVVVFVGVSVLYVLVVAGGVMAWRYDRAEREAAFALRLERATNQLKIQLNAEREDRRALEGYYILEDSANLDLEWRTVMAWADNELEANDPKGSTP
jgi:hypothetical protein